MIITLNGANFANNNINDLLNTFSVSYSGTGVTGTPRSIQKENGVATESLSATITIASNYTYESLTVRVGGNLLTAGTDYTVSGTGPVTLSIDAAKITGNVVVSVQTSSTGGDVVDPEPVTYDFPLRTGGIGITSEGTGRLSNGANRLCNGSTTEKLGILIPAGNTLTFTGLASGTHPLRFDYVYGTVDALNPAAGSTTPIEGLVGTASNYVSADYFMLNITGADSYSVTNSSDNDYYYWFVFAGLTKEEVLNTEIDTYNITYTISSNVDWLDLPTTQYALGVTSTGTGRVSANNAKRFSTADDNNANGILIPAGKTLHLVGLASGTYPLRVDYLYCTNNVTCPASGSTTPIEGLVGTASNYVSANYFPLNTAGNDAIDITNNYGEDYYFWFGFAGLTLNEGILAEYNTYDLKYYIE